MRMSLGPEQTEVCHMYINRFSQTLSESNFTFYQTFYQQKNLVHKSKRCHPHSHNLHVYSVLFFSAYLTNTEVILSVATMHQQASAQSPQKMLISLRTSLLQIIYFRSPKDSNISRSKLVVKAMTNCKTLCGH